MHPSSHCRPCNLRHFHRLPCSSSSSIFIMNTAPMRLPTFHKAPSMFKTTSLSPPRSPRTTTQISNISNINHTNNNIISNNNYHNSSTSTSLPTATPMPPPTQPVHRITPPNCALEAAPSQAPSSMQPDYCFSTFDNHYNDNNQPRIHAASTITAATMNDNNADSNATAATWADLAQLPLAPSVPPPLPSTLPAAPVARYEGGCADSTLVHLDYHASAAAPTPHPQHVAKTRPLSPLLDISDLDFDAECPSITLEEYMQTERTAGLRLGAQPHHFTFYGDECEYGYTDDEQRESVDEGNKRKPHIPKVMHNHASNEKSVSADAAAALALAAADSSSGACAHAYASAATAAAADSGSKPLLFIRMPTSFSNNASATTTTTHYSRSGAWTSDEIAFVDIASCLFKQGCLPLRENTMLRQFLARLLDCHPMRLSKRFSKGNKVGKCFYKRSEHYCPRQADSNMVYIQQLAAELREIDDANSSYIIDSDSDTSADSSLGPSPHASPRARSDSCGPYDSDNNHCLPMWSSRPKGNIHNQRKLL